MKELVGKHELPYEIINCAIGGGDLRQVKRSFYDALRYSPDAIVFLFGHNLKFNHPQIKVNLIRLSLWVRRSRLLSFLVDDLITKSHPGYAHHNHAQWIEALEAFLRKMSSETKRRGIILAMGTLPANLKIPPYFHDEDLVLSDYLKACLL